MGPSGESPQTPVIEARGLVKEFASRGGAGMGRSRSVLAVDGVSFRIHRGETLGLAGESGSGKTTTAKLVLRLLEPTAGQVLHLGGDVTRLRGRSLREFRRQAQMIFQDPYESLSPRMRVVDIVSEPLETNRLAPSRARRERIVREMLESVGLAPAAEFMTRFPHELSGGQRQRVGLARALVIGPSFLVADEPVSMLDVSIRAGVLNLLKRRIREMGLAGLYISHDLALVKHMCDRTAIMYQGRVVEDGPTREIIGNPVHPYTQALLAAAPAVDRIGSLRSPKPEEARDWAGTGCRYAPRCPVASSLCTTERPAGLEVGPGHTVECHAAQAGSRARSI